MLLLIKFQSACIQDPNSQVFVSFDFVDFYVLFFAFVLFLCLGLKQNQNTTGNNKPGDVEG